MTEGRHRILVVDDEEPILFALREYFTMRGFDVDTARDIDVAKQLLVEHSHALVVADVRLSGMYSSEGLELVEYARERAPFTRVVLLTAYGSPGVVVAANERGVDALIHKPTPLPHLYSIVTELLKDSA